VKKGTKDAKKIVRYAANNLLTPIKAVVRGIYIIITTKTQIDKIFDNTITDKELNLMKMKEIKHEEE